MSGMACIAVWVGLLGGGCQLWHPLVENPMSVVRRGEMLQCYELVRVEPDGSTVFRYVYLGEQGAPFTIQPWQRFAVKVEMPRRTLEYGFVVVRSDHAKQEVVVRTEALER